MKPLHAIAADIAAVIGDGEMPDGAEALLDALTLDMESKLESCVCVMRNYAAEAAMLKAEADHFAQRAQVASNAERRMLAYIRETLDRLNIERIDAGKFRLAIVNNGGNPTVRYSGDPEKLPEWCRQVAYAIRTDAILAAAKAGTVLPDGVTLERGKRLAVK